MSNELKCVNKTCWWREVPDENCYPCKDLRGYCGSNRKANDLGEYCSDPEGSNDDHPILQSSTQKVINRRDIKSEEDADRVAEEILRRSTPRLKRMVDLCKRCGSFPRFMDEEICVNCKVKDIMAELQSSTPKAKTGVRE